MEGGEINEHITSGLFGHGCRESVKCFLGFVQNRCFDSVRYDSSYSVWDIGNSSSCFRSRGLVQGAGSPLIGRDVLSVLGIKFFQGRW